MKRYNLIKTLNNANTEVEKKELRKQISKLPVPQLFQFKAQFVIGNMDAKGSTVLAKVDAKDVVDTTGEFYTIAGKQIRGVDADVKAVKICVRHSYGKIKRGTSYAPYNLNVINIDLYVVTKEHTYVTPLYYFAEKSYNDAIAKVYDWFAYIYEKPVLDPTKEQVRMVMQWVAELGDRNRYGHAPEFDLYKKASRLVVVECLNRLLKAGYINQDNSKNFTTYTATKKGILALNK